MKDITEIKRIASAVLKKHGIKKAGLFGSVVRKEAGESSDVDILIEPTPTMSLFDFIRIKQELEERLETPVDLVDYNTIKRQLHAVIMGEESRIYG
jgi:predicted nucleotidyltransferase